MIQSPIPEGCEAIVKDGSVVFEKEKQEFKRGDVIVSKKNEILLVDVHSFEDIMLRSFVHIRQDGALCGYSYSLWNSEYLWRLATEDEKQKLFDKMKEQGLKWNVEKKRVETIRWRAEKGEKYFSIDTDIQVCTFLDKYGVCDDVFYDALNYFHTKKQAEEAAKRVKETLRKYHEEIGE